jgi:hypothetical protein
MSLMKDNSIKSEAERPPAASQSPARKSVLILAGIIGLGAVALVVIASKHPKSGEQGHSPDAVVVVGNKTVETPQAQPIESSPSPVVTAPAIPAEAEPDRAAIARELIKSLSELRPGEITPEKAAKWNRDLEQLVEQGTAVVPPLQEFFESHADVRFDSGPGTNLLAEPSLRIAFLEVLFNVPAPENVYLQEEVLRTTSDPAEVALLARQLEAQEPGKYHDLIVSTARASLAQARSGLWPGRDANALIKVLRQNGDTTAK